MRHLVPIVLLLVVAGRVSAQDAAAEAVPASQDDEARGLFLAGRAAFDGARYEEALRHFQRAYELSGRADLLFNIGHTAQLAGDTETALASFRRYLEEKPDSPERAQIESRIARLEERREESPGLEPAAPSPERSVGAVVLIAAGGAGMAGGALSLVLAARSAHTVNSAPTGTPWVDVEGDERAAQRRAVLGGVLLGVGAAAALAGIVWFTVGSNDDVQVSLGADGATVRGSF